MAKDAIKVSHITVKEFADKYDITDNPVMANNMLQFLVKRGKAKITGQKKIEGQKGKPANIFEISEDVEKWLAG